MVISTPSPSAAMAPRWARPRSGRLGGDGVLGEPGDVGPREVVGRPQLVERVVGRVAEAVPVAEVVQPALAVVVVLVAEADEAADAVGVPGDRVRDRDVVVVGRVTERRSRRSWTRSSSRPSTSALPVVQGQVPRLLRVLQRAALEREHERVVRRDRRPTERRVLVDLDRERRDRPGRPTAVISSVTIDAISLRRTSPA